MKYPSEFRRDPAQYHRMRIARRLERLKRARERRLERPMGALGEMWAKCIDAAIVHKAFGRWAES